MKMAGIIFFASAFGMGSPLWAEVATTQVSSSASATATTMPSNAYLTEEQLVQAYRSKDYATVVRETARIQNVPSVASHYKLFDVAVLRAESYLQSKDVPAAVQGFTRAAALAPDEDRKSVMLATLMILRDMQGLKYMSKMTDEQGVLLTPTVAPHKRVAIDVLDLSKRTIVFRALCCDLMAKASQLQAVHYQNIPQLRPFIASIEDVSIAERAADGKQVETKKFQTQCAEMAGLLINNAIKQMTDQANQMRAHSNDMVRLNNMAGNTLGGRGVANNANGLPAQRVPRGITSKQANDLLNMIQTATQVPGVTRELIEKLQLDSTYFDTVNAAAKTLATLAQDILEKAPVNDNAT